MHTVWDPREGFLGLIVIGAVQHHLGMTHNLVIHLYAVHVVTQLRLMAINRDCVTTGLSLSLLHIADSNRTGSYIVHVVTVSFNNLFF